MILESEVRMVMASLSKVTGIAKSGTSSLRIRREMRFEGKKRFLDGISRFKGG
jgi:hypothetical protein